MYRYIGNKSRLLPNLLRAIREEVGESGVIADVMAGTGSVAAALRQNGYQVIASDVMTYSRHHLVTQLQLNSAPPFNKLKEFEGVDGYTGVLEHLNSLPPMSGYFYREFSPEGHPKNGAPPRKYFTPANSRKIDALRKQLNLWNSTGLLSSSEESLLKHDLIMAVNEVANISGTYGYFLSKFSKSSESPLRLKPTAFQGGRTDHIVMQGYAEEIAGEISADLCYLDPPYIKRQYAANYHILETLARGDEPNAQGKSGLRPWRDQYSNLCTKTKSMESFEKIFRRMKCPKFLISYSEDGLFPVEVLAEHFSQFGEVWVEEIKYTRFRSNSSKLTKEIAEYLIHINR